MIREREKFKTVTASVSRTPVQSGDGYGWGGTWMVSFGHNALLVGEEASDKDLAFEIALRWNSFSHGVDLHLVAAAPKLLAALKKMLPEANRIDEHLRPTFETCEEARAAIAEAEGRA